MRKKFALMLLLVCGMLMTAACGKEAVAQQEVSYQMTFINDTGKDAAQLQIRPTEDYDWTDNLLKEAFWQNGYEVPVSLSGTVPVTDAGWQVRMVFADGTEQIWDAVALQDGSTMTFSLENGEGAVTYAQELPEFPADSEDSNALQDPMENEEIENQ